MLALIIGLADLFLIYYIYYKMLLLFSGTRTNKVIWGILVLGAFTLFAQFMHLTATAWIMKQIWVAGALALVIVFQPEIRRALMTVGTGFTKIRGSSAPLLGRMRAMVSKDYNFIPPMIDAIKTAAEERTGMLIVLEQDQGVRDLITEGVQIDAVVSKELLLTIFFDKTMLHDGAVLISNNRLVMAGGYLPNTEQKELSKVLGTRHRAALGLSENSDAIVLVVSEESGQVSMARNGMLQRVNSLKDLESRLNDLYKSREKDKNQKQKKPNVIPSIPVIIDDVTKNQEGADEQHGEYRQPSKFKDIISDFFFNPPDIFKVNWQLKLLAFSLSLITYLYVWGGR